MIVKLWGQDSQTLVHAVQMRVGLDGCPWRPSPSGATEFEFFLLWSWPQQSMCLLPLSSDSSSNSSFFPLPRFLFSEQIPTCVQQGLPHLVSLSPCPSHNRNTIPKYVPKENTECVSLRREFIGLLEKWPMLGQGWQMNTMSLGHYICCDSRKLLTMVKGLECQPEEKRLPLAKDEQQIETQSVCYSSC